LQHDYEILLMLDPDLSDERQEEIIVRTRGLIEQGGGTWVGHDPWGKRRLAYPIDKKNEGIYHLLQFDADPETVDELTRILKISDGVMRHLATRRIESAHGPGRPGPEPVVPTAAAPEAEAEPETEVQPEPEAEAEPADLEPEYASANTRSQESQESEEE